MSKGTIANRARPSVGGTRNAQTIRQSIARGDLPRSAGRTYDAQYRRNLRAAGVSPSEASAIVAARGVRAAVADREQIVDDQNRAARSARRAAARAANATGRGNSRGRRGRR